MEDLDTVNKETHTNNKGMRKLDRHKCFEQFLQPMFSYTIKTRNTISVVNLKMIIL